MINNNKSLWTNIDNFLQTKKGYKKSWIRSFIVILLCSICFGVVMGISYNLGPMSGIDVSTSKDITYSKILSLPSNAEMLKTATNLSISGICIMLFPFVCGIATWMIGINQVTKSKYFHFLIWFMVFVASILAIIAIAMLIRASIFNYNEFPSSTESDETETTKLLFLNNIKNCF